MNMDGAPGDSCRKLSERIFRWIWRINGLLIFAFGVVVVGSFLADGLRQWRSRQRPSQEASPLSAQAKKAEPAALKLGPFEQIAGTHLYTARLSEIYYGTSTEYVLDPSEQVHRNVLFYDATTGSNHWLFADHADVICKLDALSPSDHADTAPSVWAWSKTHADGTYRIGLADIDGERAEPLIEADACLDQSFLQADGTVLLLYTHGGKPRASLVEAAHRRVLRTDTLLAP